MVHIGFGSGYWVPSYQCNFSTLSFFSPLTFICIYIYIFRVIYFLGHKFLFLLGYLSLLFNFLSVLEAICFFKKDHLSVAG